MKHVAAGRGHANTTTTIDKTESSVKKLNLYQGKVEPLHRISAIIACKNAGIVQLARRCWQRLAEPGAAADEVERAEHFQGLGA